MSTKNTSFTFRHNEVERTFKSKSDAIRTLSLKENYSTNEIAKLTGIRYQMVRNILLNYNNQQIVNSLQKEK